MRTVLGAALVATLVLTGCSHLPGDLYSDDVDLTRAQAVWADPWVAPGRLSVPGAGYGSNGEVRRRAGERRTTYAGVDAAAAALQEVSAAQRHDWALVGVTCETAQVRAVLTRGGTDPARAAVAEVEARPDGRDVDLAVVAEVPHHLDEDWPDLGAAVDVDQTCLAGGAGGEAPDLPGGEPRGSADDDVATPEWSDDGASAADRARVDALEDDAWFASLGVDLPRPDTDGGDRRRQAPSVTGTLAPGPRAPIAAIAAVVDSMTGWAPTYAACSPSTGGVVTLRLDGAAGPVVARLEAVHGHDGEVAWSVTLPVAGGPDQSWVDQVPALDRPACLRGTAAPRRPIIEGTPVGLVDQLQPLQ